MAFVIPAGTGYTLADAVAAGFLAKSGSTIIASGFGQVVDVVLGSDQTTASTTYVDCTGLSFSAASGVKYLISFNGIFRSSNVNDGIGLALNGPSTSFFTDANYLPITATASVQRSARAYDQGSAATSVDVADSDVLGQLDALVTTSAAGTIILRWLSETGATMTMKAGSVLTYQVIG